MAVYTKPIWIRDDTIWKNILTTNTLVWDGSYWRGISHRNMHVESGGNWYTPGFDGLITAHNILYKRDDGNRDYYYEIKIYYKVDGVNVNIQRPPIDVQVYASLLRNSFGARASAVVKTGLWGKLDTGEQRFNVHDTWNITNTSDSGGKSIHRHYVYNEELQHYQFDQTTWNCFAITVSIDGVSYSGANSFVQIALRPAGNRDFYAPGTAAYDYDDSKTTSLGTGWNFWGVSLGDDGAVSYY